MLARADVYSAAFNRGLLPPPILTVSSWAEANRTLTGKAASEPGPWRNARTPYLVEIMDALSASSPVEEVIFVKGSQVGGTEALQNWLAYVIAHAPAPMLYVLPTEVLCRRASRTRIQPLIDDSPVLSEIVSKQRGRAGGNSTLEKDFPGGVLIMTGAQSGSSLRSTPVKYVALDELDAFPLEIEMEGDPAELAVRGTRNFPDRKVARVSTPTLEGLSRITDDYARSDQSRYLVPCPECNHRQVLLWKRPDGARGIVYDLGEDGFCASVGYACENCGVVIPEHRKTWMLAEGAWVAQKPERSRRIRGFHLSALYSPLGMYSWADCVNAFVRAKDKPARLRVWVNQTLGETWREKGTAPSWERLYNRREGYARGSVPAGVCLITAGVDVQGNRLEVEYVGWGRGLESWSIDHVIISGDPAEASTWRELDLALARTFPRDALNLQVRLMAIDQSYESNRVRAWVRLKDVNRVKAIRGVEGRHMLIGTPQLQDVTVSGRKLKRGVAVWPIDVGEAKGELYANLRQEQPTHPERDGFPPGWAHFPEYDEEYFRQLTSERLQPEIDRHGRRRYIWAKRRERNEVLDLRVYARAAAAIVGVDRWTDADWAAQAALAGGPTVKAAAPKTRRATEDQDGEDYLGRFRD